MPKILKLGFELLPHPPCTPGLVTSDFWSQISKECSLEAKDKGSVILPKKIVLCIVIGPVGFLSFVITRSIEKNFFP